MTDRDRRKRSIADLRREAEEVARQRAARTPADSTALQPEEVRKTLHELQVHQIELEMQNDELRRAQVEIEAGRARYFDLYNLAPVGYCTLSEQGLILEANLTAATLLGTPRGALMTQPITGFIHRDDQETYYLHRKKLLEAGGNQKCELRLVRPDGACSWALLTGAVSRPDGSAPVFRVAIADITDRKLAEEKSEKLQAELTQAQKMESVGRLAGGVAHDFNNMLGVILGYTELAMDRVEPGEPLLADLQEIQKAARHSADLTRQLLAFARKQIITPEVLDLNQIIDNMLNMLRRLIGEDIALAWTPGRDLWPVMMDPAQIDQMVANLCVNARDAITGVGTVSIETRNTTLDQEACAEHVGCTPGDYVTLDVSDDGCGMDDQTLFCVFDPFFTTKDMGKGTGLGLATVYGIVKQNNGFIEASSEPGQGTSFSIHLPRHAARTEPRPEDPAVQAASRGRETILLVEDEPAILNMTRIMLERQGYTVLAADCPGEAIRFAREYTGPIDLLITDVIMPEMNGRELADHLSSLRPTVKRVFMSGYTSDVIAHHGVLDEREHFIQKPFSMKVLGTKLREVIEG